MPTVMAMMDYFNVVHDRVLDVAYAQRVLVNDSLMMNPGPLTASWVSGPSQGSLTLNSNGTFVYTPPAGFTGSTSFVYKASANGEWSNATVSINVTNSAPFLTGQYLSVLHDSDFDINIASYATDADNPGETLTPTIVSGPSHGTLTQNANGTRKYTPAVHYTGSDSFTAKVSDGAAFSSTVTFTISVTNQAPSGDAEEYTVPHDQTLDVQTTDGVLENDQDPDSEWLTAEVVQSPQHGTLTLDDDGAFIYEPYSDYVGNDSFTYRNSDGVAYSSSVTVTLHVTNIAPVAKVDRYRVDPLETLETDVDFGVLANDTDADDILTAELVSGPSHGTLTLNSDGTFTYEPDQNFPGSDSFTYDAVDGISITSQSVVYLTSGDAARDDSFHIAHNGTLTLDYYSGVLANDDADYTDTVDLIANPTHGTLTLNSDGSLTYVPQTGYIGIDQFTYKITGSNSTYGQSIAKIDVFNVAPIGAPDSYSTSANTQLVVNAASGVLANDFDEESDTIVLQPMHGTISFNSNGSFTYTPTVGFVGEDQFTYQLGDGSAFCSFPIFVPLVVGQPPARPTVSGTITYGTGMDAFPVRFAVVELQGWSRTSDCWGTISIRSTDEQGRYTLPFLPVVNASIFRVILYTQTCRVPLVPNHTLSVMTGLYTCFDIATRVGPLNPNANLNIHIGDTTRSEKAFWTYDAAVTANLAHYSFVDARNRPTSINIQYPWFATSMCPNEGRIDLSIADYKDWDTINHEYGHIIQREYGLYPDTGYIGGIWYHVPGENNRVQHSSSPAWKVLRLALREGFATFFGTYAETTDSTSPEIRDAGLTNQDLYWGQIHVEDETNGMSAGEDEELSVLRILWDLYDGATDLGREDINLGFQAVYDLIANRNPPAGGGTSTAFNLNVMWANILARNPDTTAANRLELTKYGAIFELNNVSPRTKDPVDDAGLYVGGVKQNTWSFIDDADATVKFWFKVPEGMKDPATNQCYASTAQLLNVFTIHFFNDDYTEMRTYTSGFSTPRPDKYISWTPTEAEWDDISINLGTGHWVIAGGWASTNLETGHYWGSANDYEINN